ncbi:major facilitator superfamily transporter [Colletotrichum abscissum]|uniref:major facilitator superfamily transporter n=1 Tax=Colletotrichum abscissum TaxID=1671311 RepID=UPI0027D5745F|nr:major facilitator superfamily transporter [Colletotrichum abscissum]KAK1491766.1 major facilitator superfamily transporter [Colletotrichum abscissum]
MISNDEGRAVVECASKDATKFEELEDPTKSSDPSVGKLSQQYDITPRDIQSRFEHLRELSEIDMTRLNKSIVRKIDMRMMPCITLMFLMRQVKLRWRGVHY